MSIKIDRALRIAGIDVSTQKASKIIGAIDINVIKALPSHILANVVEDMDKHWKKAQAAKEDEIVAEGCMWSNKDQRLIDLEK